MTINTQQEKKTIVRQTFTDQELDKVLAESGGLGVDKMLTWLESKKAIKIYRRNIDGKERVEFNVIQSQDGSFPYTQLSNLFEAANTRQAKKEYAERMNLRQLENFALQSQALHDII